MHMPASSDLDPTDMILGACYCHAHAASSDMHPVGRGTSALSALSYSEPHLNTCCVP